MKIHIINGPNLNLIGTREPHIYGSVSLAQAVQEWQQAFPQVQLSHFQSNHEGALVDNIQAQLQALPQGIIINAGAYSHSSLALADALRMMPMPVVEVHISNIFAREAERQRSMLAPVVQGQIVGLGLQGYALAIHYLISVSS